MPGLVGFTCYGLERPSSIKVLCKMRDMISHHDFYIKDELYCDGFVCSSRSHINVTQKEPQPYFQDGLYIWLDGEFYNQQEMIPSANMADPKILLQFYRNDRDFSFLKVIDGFYSAVIYDSLQAKIHLITDRYGLRHLHWTIYKGQLVWASEVKAFLSLTGYSPEINKKAVEEFIDIGYLLDDKTWFKNIEMLSSGTVLTWDIKKQTMKKNRYWWWDKIRPSTKEYNEDEISEELGELFVNAVERRTKENDKHGLLLSGGLDSRAVLAAAPIFKSTLNVFTFGKKGCDDIRIAESAAKVKGAAHHVFEITKDNWLTPRLNGVWWTDGDFDLMHMHGIEAIGLIRSLFDINLSGFAGDLVLGGSFLKDKRYLDSMNCGIIAEAMRCNPAYLEKFDDYLNLTKSDYYFLQNRKRRFAIGGAKLLLTEMEQRMPFLDNKLIEFVYSLPDLPRFRSYIYKKTLLKAFPRYYEKIPWQQTGVPISWPLSASNAVSFVKRVNRKMIKELNRLGINIDNAYSYTDYPNWLRQEPARSFCYSVLNNPSAIYPEYISKNQVLETYKRHLAGKNHSEEICRYLTFEVWLQQVFEGKYLQEMMRAGEDHEDAL